MNKIVVIILCSVLLAACATGRQMSQNQIEQIVAGQTSKSEMIRMFGPPLSQSYSSDGKLMMSWFYTRVGPFGVGMEMQQLAVLFDDAGRVDKFNLVDNAGR